MTAGGLYLCLCLLGGSLSVFMWVDLCLCGGVFVCWLVLCRAESFFVFWVCLCLICFWVFVCVYVGRSLFMLSGLFLCLQWVFVSGGGSLSMWGGC